MQISDARSCKSKIVFPSTVATVLPLLETKNPAQIRHRALAEQKEHFAATSIVHKLSLGGLFIGYEQS